MKKFAYHDALDHALQTKSPSVICSVLDELINRNGLTIALSGRDDIGLAALLQFLHKYIDHPFFAALCMDVTNTIINIYGQVLGHSVVLDDLFLKLNKKLKEENELQQSLFSLLGTVELYINSSTLQVQTNAFMEKSLTNVTGATEQNTLTSEMEEQSRIADEEISAMVEAAKNSIENTEEETAPIMMTKADKHALVNGIHKPGMNGTANGITEHDSKKRKNKSSKDTGTIQNGIHTDSKELSKKTKKAAAVVPIQNDIHTTDDSDSDDDHDIPMNGHTNGIKNSKSNQSQNKKETKQVVVEEKPKKKKLKSTS